MLSRVTLALARLSCHDLTNLLLDEHFSLRFYCKLVRSVIIFNKAFMYVCKVHPYLA